MIKKTAVCLTVFLLSLFSAIPFLRAQYEEQSELISLDFKGMDIHDVLKILSQKSGFNIVADRDVKGTVSLYIKDIDVMDALDIVATTNGLAYEREGILIRVMTDASYEKLHGKKFVDKTETEIVKLNYAAASDIAEAVMKMKSRLGKVISDDRSNTVVLIDNPDSIKKMKEAISRMDTPLTTEVFSLDYAKAEVLRDKLERMLSEDIGSIKFDERTNKIVVEDTPKRIEDIKRVVEAFDEKTREVVIDANIIQVTLSDKYSYGIDWTDIAKLGDVTLAGDTNLTTSLTGTSPNTLTVGTATNYTTVISLLKKFGETNVLSRPRITVADREEAKILVGSKEVYVTSEVTTTSGGTYHTTDHVEFVDVGVRLAVTPEINKAGFIKLKIKPEVSATDSTKTVTLENPDGSTRTIVPFVTTSEAETTVLVKDKNTLVIGGLMKDTVVDYSDKIPLLGDIPLLGKLFSTKGKSKEKTELVIFLTPHIIEGDTLTKEAKSYLGEWQEKEKNADIERPKDPELKMPEGWKKNKKDIKEKRPLVQTVKKKKDTAKAKPKAKAVKNKAKWEPLLTSGPKKTALQKPQEEKSPVTSAEKTTYEEYYLTVREEVNNIALRQDVSGIKGEVEVQFNLDKNGFITRGPTVLNKPDLQLVRNAVNCVKQAAPFPPFPRSMNKDEAEFLLVVRYE